MGIEIKIDKTEKFYHYNTKEEVMVCPKCNREYKTRKYCLDCYKKKKEKIETIKTIKEHEGWITNDLKLYSCDCPFAAFHGQSRYWWELRPNSVCKHCKWILKRVKKDLYNRCDCTNQDEKRKLLPRLR